MTDEEYSLLKSRLDELIIKCEEKDKEVQKQKIAGILFYYFPGFEKDYEKLIQNRVIAITQNDELVWLYSKSSLCEYFREKSRTKKTNWQVLEGVFHHEKLGEINKKAQGESRDYKRINKIIK